MYHNPLQFVSGFEEALTILTTDISLRQDILTDVKSWSLIREKKTVQEDELGKYILDYRRFTRDVATQCDNPECPCFRPESFMIDPFVDPADICVKRHDGDDALIAREEDHRRSKSNTLKWISGNTASYLSRTFPVNVKVISEEDKRKLNQDLERMKGERQKDLQISDENSPWFRNMGEMAIQEERKIFDPLRKPGIRIGDNKFSERYMKDKADQLLNARQEEERERKEDLDRKERRDDTERNQDRLEHAKIFSNVLKELIDASFVDVLEDNKSSI